MLEGSEISGSPVLFQERNDGLHDGGAARRHRNAIELANRLRSDRGRRLAEDRVRRSGRSASLGTNGKTIDAIDHHDVRSDVLRHRVVIHAAEVLDSLSTAIDLHRNAKSGLDLRNLGTNNQNFIGASLLDVIDTLKVQPLDNHSDRLHLRLSEL